MRTRHLIALILLSILAMPLHAGPLQQGFSIEYAVKRKGLALGKSERAFRPVGNDQWQFDARTAPTGMAALFFKDVIEEHSLLQLTPDGVRPLDYRFDRAGGRREKHYALRYDWSGQALHYNSDELQVPLATGTQDPLSFLIEVMGRLGRGEREFPLSIADRNRVKDYQLRPHGEQHMKTPLGRLRVLHIQAKEIGKETYYDLWCAPSLDYLPVRIRQRRSGETTDLMIKRFSLLASSETAAAGKR